jgi:coenzyme Q-binding protein COQ10
MRHSLTRALPYAPGDLFDLVGDVEAYPQFVRWITELKTKNRRDEDEGVTVIDAQAKVKFSIISETFATRVRLDRPNLAIDVALLSGPFKQLETHWRFAARGPGTALSFVIDLEFRSRLLKGLFESNVDRAAAKLVRCFEVRAAELYGGAEWKQRAGS